MSSTPGSAVSETYQVQDGEGVARVHDFMEAREAAGRSRPAPRYFLAGATPGEQVELPEEVYRILRQVVEAMRRGMSVTISPVSQTLTTQVAADLLGISRPTVVKLLEDGRIPFERINGRRIIKLADLLDYRERRRREQYRSLEAMSTDLDEDTPIDEVLADLRRARQAVAAKRHSGAGRS